MLIQKHREKEKYVKRAYVKVSNKITNGKFFLLLVAQTENCVCEEKASNTSNNTQTHKYKHKHNFLQIKWGKPEKKTQWEVIQRRMSLTMYEYKPSNCYMYRLKVANRKVTKLQSLFVEMKIIFICCTYNIFASVWESIWVWK